MAFKPQGEWNVVSRRARMQALEKPQPLLRKGKGSKAGVEREKL
jgi:hypothetical protein